MGGKPLMWFLLLGVSSAQLTPILVDISSERVKELGWTLTCKWKMPMGDQLQSVRLYNHDQQFMIYRPERQGTDRGFFRTPNTLMKVDCVKRSIDSGTCLIVIEPYSPPPTEFTFTCEVSGERPFFKISAKNHTISTFVPPENTVINVLEQREPPLTVVNCSTAGLPEPNFIWTVGDQKVKEDFNGKVWNSSSKLWHVWSSISPKLLAGQNLPVVCTPFVNFEDHVTTGEQAELTLTGNGEIQLLGTSSNASYFNLVNYSTGSTVFTTIMVALNTLLR